jgi:hypothetical protein
MKLPRHRRLRRRELLRALGSAALALPCLEILAPDVRARQAANTAKLAVFIYTNDGVYQNAFWPKGDETDFVLSDILSPLAPYRDKLLLLGPRLDTNNHPLTDTGLTYAEPPPQHRAPVCLTANVKHIDLSLTKDEAQSPTTVNNYTDDTSSIDQVIAEAIKGDSQFASLNLGMHCFGGDTVSDVNYLRGTAQKRVTSADEAWQRVFGGFVDVANPNPNGPREAEQALRRHGALKDFLHGRFSSLRGSLGKADQHALDVHLESLGLVEARKESLLRAGLDGASPGCSKPTRRDVPHDEDAVRTGADTELLSPLFMDIIAGAFSCGLTKVASISFGYPGGGGEGGLRMPWLGFSNAQHGVSHHNEQAANVQKYSAMNKWTYGQVAYLMQQLDAVPHAGGSLLDQTLIYVFNRHGEGNAHTNFALPNLVLGGCGNHFKMGRFLQLPRTNPTNLLISLAHAMGVELTEFGQDALKAQGPLAGLT